ncbi:MAG: hypothetical protein ACRDSZ_05870 [Pseudonocardiaceae bacterium]
MGSASAEQVSAKAGSQIARAMAERQNPRRATHVQRDRCRLLIEAGDLVVVHKEGATPCPLQIGFDDQRVKIVRVKIRARRLDCPSDPCLHTVFVEVEGNLDLDEMPDTDRMTNIGNRLSDRPLRAEIRIRVDQPNSSTERLA